MAPRPPIISVVATAAAIPAGAACLYRDSAEYLFAAFFALAILTIVTPARTLHSLLPWERIALLPLANVPGSFSSGGYRVAFSMDFSLSPNGRGPGG